MKAARQIARSLFLPALLLAARASSDERPPLETIPFPPTKTLEPVVAAQIQGVRGDLAALLAAPGAASGQLAETYGELGQLFHAYELWDAAAASYRNAMRLAPRDYRWVHLLADADTRRGDLDGARRHHEAALALRPGDVPSLVGLGETCLALGRLDDAARALGEAATRDARSAAAHAGLARVAAARRDDVRARDEFETALRLAPDATRLHYELAMAYRGLGDRASAAEHLARAGTVGVRVADPLLEAVLDLRQGARTHLVRGRLAFVNGRMREAADEFAAAVAAEPGNVSALVGLGAAQAALGSGDAIATFRRALAIDPRNVSAHFNLARLLAGRADFAGAAHHYTEVLEVDPGDEEARHALSEAIASGRATARALLRLGRCEEAAAEASRLLESSAGASEDVRKTLEEDLERARNGVPCGR